MRKTMCALTTILAGFLMWSAGCGGGGGGGLETPAAGTGSTAPPGQIVRSISGQVVDAQGQPVVGALVGLPAKSRQTAGKTDQSGRFLLVVHIVPTATSLALEITMPFGSTAETVVPLPPGETSSSTIVVAIPGATPSETNAPPVISAVTVTPTVIDVSGGVVQVSASIADSDSSDLTAVALLDNGDQLLSAVLQPQGGTYVANLSLSANTGTYTSDRTVNVWVCVTDAPDGSCASVVSTPVSVTLKGMPTPPSFPADLD